MRQFSIFSLLFVAAYIAVAVALSQMVLRHMRIYDVGFQIPIVYISVRNSIVSVPRFWFFAPAMTTIADTLLIWLQVSSLFGTIAEGANAI